MLDVIRLGRNISSDSHLKPYPVNAKRRTPRKPSVQLRQLTKRQQQHIPFQYTQQPQQQGGPNQPTLAFYCSQPKYECRNPQLESLAPEESHGTGFHWAKCPGQQAQGE